MTWGAITSFCSHGVHREIQKNRWIRSFRLVVLSSKYLFTFINIRPTTIIQHDDYLALHLYYVPHDGYSAINYLPCVQNECISYTVHSNGYLCLGVWYFENLLQNISRGNHIYLITIFR